MAVKWELLRNWEKDPGAGPFNCLGVRMPNVADASEVTPAAAYNGLIWYDADNHTFQGVANGLEITFSSTAGVGTLQQVTTAGKTSNVVAVEFTGASSAANGVLIGDGTRKLQLYTDGTDSYIGSAAGDIKIVPNGGDVDITGTLSASGAFDCAAATVLGALTVGADGAGHDVQFFSDTAGDSVKFNDTEKCMVWEDCTIQMNDSDAIQLGAGSAVGTGDFAMYCDGTDIYVVANAAVAGQAVRIGGATNEVDLVWNSTTSGAEVTFDSDAVAVVFDGVTCRMNDSDAVVFGDDQDFTLSYTDADKDLHLSAAADIADQCLHIGDASNDIDIQWYGDTGGDLVLFDSSDDSVLFTDIDLKIAETGAECALDVSSAATGVDCTVLKGTAALTDGFAVCGIKGTGNIGDGGAVLNLDYATGNPHAAARIFEIQGAGKDLRGVFADVDSVTNDAYVFHSGGATATGKSVMRISADGTPAAATTHILEVDGSNGTWGSVNCVALSVLNAGTAACAEFDCSNGGATGSIINLVHSGGSAANADVIARLQFIGQTADDTVVSSGRIDNVLDDNTNASMDSALMFYQTKNNVETLGFEINSTGCAVGTGGAAAYLTSSGAYDLNLRVNDGTNSGLVTLASGANADITLKPNGTGQVEVLSTDTGTIGAQLDLRHTPGNSQQADEDIVGIVRFYGQDDAAGATENLYGSINCVATDSAAAGEDGRIDILVQKEAGSAAAYMSVRPDLVLIGNGASAYLSSAGAQDLFLETNSGTNSGIIQIEDAAAGAIRLQPNTTGIVEIKGTDVGALGAVLKLNHQPSDNSQGNDDVIARIQFTGQQADNTAEDVGKIDVVIRDITDGAVVSDMMFYTDVAGAETLRMELNNYGLAVGSGAAAGIVTSASTQDLTLNTNGGTNSGSIVITDAANGNITVDPNGTGRVAIVGAALANSTAHTNIPQIVCMPVVAASLDDAGGLDNDIVLFNANSPKMRILDAWYIPIVANGAALTLTLRDTQAGGGNAISSALDTNSGTTFARTTSILNAALNANSSLMFHGSTDGTNIEGTVCVMYIEVA